MRDEIEFLIDGAYAEGLGMLRILNLYFGAVENDLAGALLIGPAQDFHERGFARSVLAEEDVNFTPLQLKINVVKRHDTGERLPDMAHFQNGRFCHLGI